MSFHPKCLVKRAALPALFLLFISSHLATAQISDTYDRQIDNKFSPDNPPQQDENNLTAEQIQMADLARAVKAQAQQMSLPPPSPPAPLPSASVVGSAVAVPLSTALFIGLVALLVKRKVDSVILASETARGKLNLLESDPSLEGFFVELRDGLGAHVKAGKASIESSPGAARAELEPFLESLPRRFADFRALVSQIGRASGNADRKEPLASLYDEITALKDNAQLHDLKPAWLLACATDGLLKQILNGTSEFNASIQRSIVAAIDLLEALCADGVNPTLATNPPIRILAVDDDPVSRCAISFALKKVFDAPTLASGGEEALAFATKQSYDIIFLDVEMPGMDGYELCTKIRETLCNKNTPAVFVTRHSDFNSRAKSSISGGQDLIGKPYLSFEITVKALTLVLRNRLQPGAVVPRTLETAAPGSAGVSPASAASPQAPDLQKPYTTTVASTYSSSTGAPESESEPQDSPAPFQMRVNDSADPFPEWAPAYLENLRNQLQTAAHCSETDDLQEFLTGAYLAIHSFGVEAERAELRNIYQISSVLEKMLKKLMESPKLCTPSTLEAATAALELLAEFSSQDGDCPNFADPLPRILVVDDDPLARRAISGAIQLVFGKPDSAESGEAAIAIAAEKPFDLIFLDVLMPGIDGFATCKKVHQTIANHQTPVIFITNHDDAKSRAQASSSGGSGFIPKPALASQITLTAVTLILRARLDKMEFVPPGEGSSSLISAL